jgi:probable rRNA maturation factor
VPYDITVEFHDSAAPVDRATVDLTGTEALIARVLAEESVPHETALTVLFGDDEFLRTLNREHREIDEPTDVLSFPADEENEDDDAAYAGAFPGAFPDTMGQPRYLGDIAISVPTALRQAAAAGLEPAEELAHLVLHGLLHILGYDHETPEGDALMRAREEAELGPQIHAAQAHDLH